MNNTGPVLMIILSVALFYLFIDPQYTEVKDLWNENVQYKEAMESAKEIDTLAAELLAKKESFSLEDRAKLEKMIPATIDVVAIANELSTLASSRGVLVNTVKENEQSASAGEAEFRKTLIAVSARGSYQSVLSFLGDMEKSLRLLDVKNISFNSASAAPGGILSVNLLLQAYSLK